MVVNGGAAYVLAEALHADLHEGVACLVKGSRSAHMEAVIERLVAGEAEAC